MIIGALLNLLAVLAQAVSVPLSVITLPAWFTDGTIDSSMSSLHGYIWDSPASSWVDLEFVFAAVEWYWGFRLATIPVRWLLGIARRFLGPIVPTFDFNGAEGFTFGSEYGRETGKFQAKAQPFLDRFNAKHAEET